MGNNHNHNNSNMLPKIMPIMNMTDDKQKHPDQDQHKGAHHHVGSYVDGELLGDVRVDLTTSSQQQHPHTVPCVITTNNPPPPPTTTTSSSNNHVPNTLDDCNEQEQKQFNSRQVFDTDPDTNIDTKTQTNATTKPHHVSVNESDIMISMTSDKRVSVSLPMTATATATCTATEMIPFHEHNHDHHRHSITPSFSPSTAINSMVLSSTPQHPHPHRSSYVVSSVRGSLSLTTTAATTTTATSGMNPIPSSHPVPSPTRRRIRSSEKWITVRMFSIFVIFICCWTSFIIMSWSELITGIEASSTWVAVSEFFALLTACINPILYVCLDKRYRYVFIKLLRIQQQQLQLQQQHNTSQHSSQ